MTLFSKIIEGNIPSYKIMEDELTFAFLDIYPNNLGHTLIVPKLEVASFLDLPPEYNARIFENAQKIGQALQKVTNCQRVGLTVHGFGIPDHFHLHIVPMFGPQDLDQGRGKEFSTEEMAQAQAKIIQNLV